MRLQGDNCVCKISGPLHVIMEKMGVLLNREISRYVQDQ